ncbi:DUF4442 domain-containing protein [Marinobacter apostichopi]|uniref:DUF4442 domain-containing protein n=1 Tax=Marinobacter apostichopi TaxID=3035454 RepID=UPI0025748847|nr:DUF4442 domain-containing protein [Marinobacter sp. LA51]
MANANKLSGIVSKINRLPDFARSRALTLFFGKVVPFTVTTGIRIESLDQERCVISLANKRRVQNHIGGVHAVASLVLAESATGFLVGLNVPDDKVPVIKTASAEYTRRAKGDMTVQAHLTEEQRERMRTEEKGDVSVPVTIHDSEGKEPIEIEMVWAWTPKRR